MSCVHPGMIPGSSEYPRNPGILRQGGVSCVHPGMILGSSEYTRNPRILRQGGGGGELCPSWDYPRIVRVSQESQDTQTGGGGGGGLSCVHPSRDNPGIVRVSQESQDTQTGGGGELCPSRDDPRIVRVSQESQDTQTGGVVSCVHPGMIPGSSEYPRNPRILRQGGVSCVHPWIILGSSEYPRNPRILRQGGGGELCPSWDDPRIVRVSQESQDTQTGGVVSCVHPGMIPGSSEYPRNPRILRQGGVSCVHPGMILGSSEYPRNPRILRQGGGGGELCPSWDDPRIVRVSQESQDTQTGGG